VKGKDELMLQNTRVLSKTTFLLSRRNDFEDLTRINTSVY